jgi:hypothetical protein
MSTALALAVVFTSLAWSSQGFSVPSTFPNLTQCLGANAVKEFSCENITAIRNTCCTPTPGGLVLQTQFWSTYTGLEREGQLLPKDSWTIHGLWLAATYSFNIQKIAEELVSGLTTVMAHTSNTATCRDSMIPTPRLLCFQTVQLYLHGKAPALTIGLKTLADMIF